MTEEEKKALELAEQKKLDDEKTIKDLQLEKIEEMKLEMETMVNPEKYAKLKKEYKTLMDDYVNKRPVPKEKEIKFRPTKEIAKELGSIESGDISNRAYVAKSLEYRNAHIAEFGTDPFADFGQEGAGSSTDDTKQVADVLQKLLDENKSPEDFRLKLHSVLKDDQTLIKKLRKRK